MAVGTIRLGPNARPASAGPLTLWQPPLRSAQPESLQREALKKDAGPKRVGVAATRTQLLTGHIGNRLTHKETNTNEQRNNPSLYPREFCPIMPATGGQC